MLNIIINLKFLPINISVEFIYYFPMICTYTKINVTIIAVSNIHKIIVYNSQILTR